MIYHGRQDLTRAIKAHMVLEDISGEEIASALGVSPSSFSRTINRTDMTFDTAKRIAEALGLVLCFSFEHPTEEGEE